MENEAHGNKFVSVGVIFIGAVILSGGRSPQSNPAGARR